MTDSPNENGDEFYHAIQREKSPQTFGKNKYLVELFISQRHVVTVFADTPELAEKRACNSVMVENGTLRGFGLSGGVSGVHFDEDYGCEVKTSAPEEADE